MIDIRTKSGDIPRHRTVVRVQCDIVARVFNKVMQDYLCHFDAIEYAVYHTECDAANYEVFCKEI